jgi:putative SOS response-associated peptidase YedK
MEKIHDRMPVILSEKNEEAWLDPDSKSFRSLVKPCAPTKLAAFELSTLVNSPKNNRPEVLKPAS